MGTKRSIIGTITLFCLSAVLALSLLSAASNAQSKDDRKDRKSDERKSEEPKRDDRSERQSSQDRTQPREPVRESKDKTARESGERKTREQPSRSDGTKGERSSGGERGSSRDRDTSGRSSSSDRRTVPDRSTTDGTTRPVRRVPPRKQPDRDYDRSKDEGSAGVRPVDPVDPSVRPRRKDPEEEGVVTKKRVPVPDDRIRIIVEGWPSPPPWYRPRLREYVFLHPYIERDPYLIHLPFGTIRPREIADGFIDLLNGLWEDGMQDALLVCIIQTYMEMDVDRFDLFFDAEDEVTVYGSFNPRSYLALISVESIFELLEDPRVRWIGEYKPHYKINDSARLWEHNGAFVFPLEDDSIEFRDDLRSIYLAPEFYDEELGFYFVPADNYELEAISEFWWVGEVLRVVNDPDLVYEYDYRTYE